MNYRDKNSVLISKDDLFHDFENCRLLYLIRNQDKKASADQSDLFHPKERGGSLCGAEEEGGWKQP